MARRRPLLICFALCWSAASLALGQTPAATATPTETPPSKKAEKALKQNRKLDFEGAQNPEFEKVRQALNALKPAQRKRFEENFIRWSNLSPEEKKALLDREQFRRKLMQKEVDEALQESGLQIEGDRRAAFAKRYTEERRKIEEQLRKETNEKRKPLVRDLIGRLRAEFSATVAATPAPTPTP